MAKQAMKKISLYMDDHTMSFVRWMANDDRKSEAEIIRRAIQELALRRITDLVVAGKSKTVACKVCGHRWTIDTVNGYWGCPNCGAYDGHHHFQEV